MTPRPALQLGDCLLYGPVGWTGWIISLKTWHAVAHCETYIGAGCSVASRDGLGVDTYPVREAQLIHVLRPAAIFNVSAALRWHEAVAKGQGYDWLGLLRFAWRAKVVPDALDNRQFCSEYTTRFYRAGGLDPFNGHDADAMVVSRFG